jgi:GNAT superfamily N-acetyltransferase
MSDVRIKRTRDLELMQRLHADLFPIDDFPTSEDTVWWVALGPSGAPCGFAAARLCDDDTSVFLERAGVCPQARGQGLQRRLIRARERWAKAQGAAWSVTYTSPTNPASANSLIGAGYRLYRPSFYWGCKDSLYFRRQL